MEEILKEEKSKSHKEFEKLLSEDLNNRKLKEGEIITGTVSGISKRHIFIDISAKSEGAIPIEEFKLTKEIDKIKIGSKLEVLLEKIENYTGDVVVSREKARRAKSWKKMEKAFENKEEVKGIIISRCKGGFVVNVESCLCFLPGSQVDLRPLKNFDHLMKVPQTFECVKLDKKRGNIVLSRRAIMEKIRDKGRDKLISKLKEGDVVQGIVKNLTDWGVFVDLNGVDSLLHITDISWSRINKPSELLSIGQSIKVKITKISGDKKISVSVKDLSEDPYVKEIDKFELGKNYPAIVTKVVDYGAFASLAPGLEGLIHSSEISHTKKNIHPGKVLSTSQKINVQILDKDVEKRRISLSYKNTLPNPWIEFTKKYKTGDIVEGVVKSVTNFAIFFTIKNSELDSMIHYKNLSYSESESELEKYKKKQSIKAKILEINQEQSKIRCGIRELEEDPFSFFEKRKKQDVITVIVESISKNGIRVHVGNKKGFLITIKKNQLARENENQRPTRFTPGQKTDCLITELDIEKREVSLSIKALEEKESKEALKKYGSEDSGMKLKDILGPLINKKNKK